MTLHEAILIVLKENGGRASVKDVTRRINELNLYQRGDNTLLEQKQVIARVRKYNQLFEIKGDTIQYLELSPNGRSFNYSSFLFNNANSLFQRTERNWYFVISAVYFYAAISNKLKHTSILKYSFRYDLSPISFKTHLLDFYETYSKILESKSPRNFIDVLHQIPDSAFEHLYEELIQYEFAPEFIIHEKIGIDFNRFWVENVEFNTRMGEFSSPSVLRLFVSKLITEKSFKVLYDPAVGIGNLLLESGADDASIFGQDIDPEVATIAYMNLTLNGFENVTIECGDSLTSPMVQQGQADLIITAPPFINDTVLFDGYPRVIEELSVSILNLFIQLVVSTLSAKGIAIIHIPDGFLYSGKKGDKALREYLLSHDLLETVISLPPGILWPFTGVKTSILVLSKSKSEVSKGKVFVMDTESYLKAGKTTRLEFDGQVFEVLQKREEIPFVSTFVNNNILINSSDLNVKALTMDWTSLTEYSKAENSNFEELRNLVSTTNFPTVRDNPKNYPVIKVSHLCGDLDDYPFDLKELDNEFKFTSGKLVEEDVILVAKTGNDLKATAFWYIDKPIIVDNNILILVPDLFDKKISATYLLFELHKEYISHQVKTINRGSTIPHRTTEDLLSLKILIGDFDFQSKSIQKFKEAYKKLLAERHETERKRWGFDHDDILPHLQHTYSQLFSSLSGQIINVENFLGSKVLNNELVDWDNKMSSRPDSISLKETFTFLKTKFDDATKLVATLKRVFGEAEVTLESTSICEIIKNVFQEFHLESSSKDLYIMGSQPIADIDREQFHVLLRNIFSNALKHGFAATEKGNLVFELSVTDDRKFLVIRYFNDGKPLREGFTFEDMLKYGKRVDKQKGSGFGGYIMEKIIKNHHGVIREIPGEMIPIVVDDNKVVYSKFKFEILIPYLHD
jgi:type I restriction enzyme M protein